MFADTPSFSSFAVDDLDAARRFYGETLGVNVSDGPMGVLGLDLAGGTTMVYPKPDFTPATYTVLNFRVDGQSMTPNLDNEQMLLVNLNAYQFVDWQGKKWDRTGNCG